MQPELKDTLRACSERLSGYRQTLALILASTLSLAGCKPTYVIGYGNVGGSDRDPNSSGETTHYFSQYPDRSKLAVIINGDSRESRHVSNVNRAVEVLSENGFTNFHVASSQQEIEGSDRLNINKKPGTVTGVRELFAEIKSGHAIQRNGLVFLYTTGHGWAFDSNVPGGHAKSCLSLEDKQCIGIQEFSGFLTQVRNKAATILAFMDQCKSGNLVADVMHAGVGGYGWSPSEEDHLSRCGAFSPNFFSYIKEGVDVNGDGLSEPYDWFVPAIDEYKRGEGTFLESWTELSPENINVLLDSPKPLIVSITSPFCGACKQNAKNLFQLKRRVGERVNFARLTDLNDDEDVQKRLEPIKKRLGISVESLPSLFIKGGNGKTVFLEGLRSPAEIIKILEELES